MTISTTAKQVLGAASLASLLSLGAMQAAQAVPVLSITASPATAVVGSPLALDVRITDIVDLYAFQFSLAFNPAVLQAMPATEGPFLSAGGGTFFGGGTVDNTAGKVSFVIDSLIGPVAGVNGSGSLARILFNVTAAGTSPLTFANVLFLNSAQNDITVQINNRSITAVVPEPAALLLMALGVAALVGLGSLRKREPR
ncbi:MAG: cohesin domain-containing protein [Rubrivivax sp.]